MTTDTITRIDLGVGRPDEIKTVTLVDSELLVVLDVDVMPMPREAARRLGEALIKAAEG